jgi:hypothetical protein
MAIAIGFMDVCSTHEVISGILENGDPQKAWVSIQKWFYFDDLGVPRLSKPPFRYCIEYCYLLMHGP